MRSRSIGHNSHACQNGAERVGLPHTGAWAMSGYFERADRGGISGWVEAHGKTPSLTAVIDGTKRERIDGSAFRAADPGRLRFDLSAKLEIGARVEILNTDTGEALPGGVRFIAKPGWTPKLGIVAPAKCEARYLVEWIAYHRVLGVRRFFIADNGGEDGTSEVLQALDAAGLIVRLDWRDAKYFQLDFYNRTIPRLIGLVDVVAVVDCDEFFRPLDGCASVPEAVAGYFSNPRTVVVGINWASYGSSGRTCAGEGLVLERFTKRGPRDFASNHHIKCFIRPHKFIPNNPTPHFFNFDQPGGRYIDSRGDSIEWSSELGVTRRVVWNMLRLDHFSIKSHEEFQVKIARGSSDNPANISTEAHFRAVDVNDIEDPVDAGLLARTRIEMERIRSRLPPSFWRRFDLSARRLRSKLAQCHYRAR